MLFSWFSAAQAAHHTCEQMAITSGSASRPGACNRKKANCLLSLSRVTCCVRTWLANVEQHPANLHQMPVFFRRRSKDGASGIGQEAAEAKEGSTGRNRTYHWQEQEGDDTEPVVAGSELGHLSGSASIASSHDRRDDTAKSSTVDDLMLQAAYSCAQARSAPRMPKKQDHRQGAIAKCPASVRTAGQYCERECICIMIAPLLR